MVAFDRVIRTSTRVVMPALAALAVTALPAMADEWVVSKTRGLAFVHADGGWARLERGASVGKYDVVRTLPSGRAEFRRGDEVIALAGDSQIRIVDAAGRKFTTVHQSYGAVTVEADKRKVQHFAVETPYLAAVVKGTRFTVVSRNGEAKVSVSAGRVTVADRVHGLNVDVLQGQQARASETQLLSVRGRGDLQPVVQQDGTPLTGRERAAMAKAAHEERSGSSKGASAAPQGGRGSAPGRDGGSPGHSASAGGGGNGARSGSDSAPGNSGNAPGHSGGAPGNSDSAPGHSGGAPGNSENAR